MKKNKEKKNKNTFANCVFMLRQIWKYNPKFIIFTILEGTVYGVCYSLTTVVLIKTLYDKLESGDFKATALVVILTLVISSLASLYSYLFGWAVKQWYRQKLHIGMHSALYQKAMSLDLSCYDDPEFYNDFIWAINESDSRASSIVEDLRILISNAATTFTTLGLMFSVEPIAVIYSLAVAFVNTRSNLFFNKLWKTRSEEAQPNNRKMDYVTRALTLPEYAKEIRTGYAYDLLKAEYAKTIEEDKRISIKYGKKSLLWSNIFGAFQTVSEGAVYIYFAYRLFSGGITLGEYAAMTTIFWRLFWGFTTISRQFTKLSEHGLYAEKYRTFIEYEPKIKDGEKKAEKPEVIRFEDVSFRYPSNEEDTLHNVTFSINKGEKVAIVGYNGAGKTTLIKLLLRLYDPTEGTVTVNGEDIKNFSVDSYRENFGTVFQDFQIFAATIAENVVAGEYSPEMKERVLKALSDATFENKLEKLEKGIDTPLTREFDDDGVNLSGGETQKIAIARVFAGEREVIVMDEPSSALDPMSEYELNRTIMESAKDKTVIFISHRLSTTRMANRILMFAEGKLIEDGSHKELMALGGKYAEMFNMQAEKYNKS
ncbi:MAG: ABC transporter ATP-binding protein [Clostridia bacterium]|nr:ABC transporter ATP-binding protein [Clostridia bacterium]